MKKASQWVSLASNITYSDERDRAAKLTPDELRFFRDTVIRARKATGIVVRIATLDHEELPGHEEALGICWKGANGDMSITIDNYFIHECFLATQGFPTIETQTLTDVICHELAHLRYWRHTKWHAALTAQYVKMVEAYSAEATA